MVQATETEQLSSYEDPTDIPNDFDDSGSVRGCGLRPARGFSQNDLLAGGSHANGIHYLLI